MVKTILLLCGPPACGKSELVRSLKSRIPWCTCLVFDEVFSVEEQQHALLEENGFKKLREKFLNVGKDILDRALRLNDGIEASESRPEELPSLLVVEDNFYRRSMRYKWFQEARERQLSFCTVFFTTSMEICLDRNRRRRQPVPDEVIMEQFSKLEVPDSDANFWERFSLVAPSLTVKEVIDAVSASEKVPFTLQDAEQRIEDLEKSRQQTQDSSLHQIDLAFRRAVSVLVKNAPPPDRQAMFARLTRLKPSVIASNDIPGNEEMDAFVLALLNELLLDNTSKLS